MIERGAGTKKLNEELVQQMREAYGQGATQGSLARHFGVSIGQVGRIVRGENWQKGAGQRAPTQAEMDNTLRRLLAEQARYDVAPELVTASPPIRRAPPSLLDGGDAPEETNGAGLTKVQEKAAALGLDIDKLLERQGK